MRDVALPFDPPTACASAAETADLLCVALLYGSYSLPVQIEPWLNATTGQAVVFVRLPHAQFALSVATARLAVRTLANTCRPAITRALSAACDEAEGLARAFQMRSAH